MNTPQRQLGTWAHTPATVAEVEQMVEHLAGQGITTVCAYAKTWNGSTNYPSAVAQTTAGYEDGLAFRALIDACHNSKMAVEGWVCTFTESRDSRLFLEHPDCRAEDRDGRISDESGAVWPCPARPESQAYELAICRELLDRYPDLDRLHLDYIRYPWSGAAVCSCAYCRQDFRQRYGYDLLTEVIAGADEGPGFEDFVTWRCGHIRGFVAQARELTRARGIGLTAAVFPYYPSIIFDLGQDWVAWCREGLVDAVYPMNYNRYPYLVQQFTGIHTTLLAGSPVRLCEGIWARDGMTPAQVQALHEAADQPGVQGIMIFPAANI